MDCREPDLEPRLARPRLGLLQEAPDDVVKYAAARLRYEGSATMTLLGAFCDQIQELLLDSALQDLAIWFPVTRNECPQEVPEVRAQGLPKVGVHPERVHLGRVDEADDELLVEGEQPDGEDGNRCEASDYQFQVADVTHHAVRLLIYGGSTEGVAWLQEVGSC